MSVNNETGIIQPIQLIGEMLKDHQAYFHTDAVQAYSQMEIDVKKGYIDLLTVSSLHNKVCQFGYKPVLHRQNLRWPYKSHFHQYHPSFS